MWHNVDSVMELFMHASLVFLSPIGMVESKESLKADIKLNCKCILQIIICARGFFKQNIAHES